MVHPKIMIFSGYIVQCVSFEMPLELPQSEVRGEGYGRFTKTVQIGLKTDILVFYPILGTLLWKSHFMLKTKVFGHLLIFSYWGFKSSFEV